MNSSKTQHLPTSGSLRNFKYHPLQPVNGVDQIRLLTILPDAQLALSGSTSPMRIKLYHTSLKREMRSFTALSYSWGNATDLVTIWCNDQPLKITRSLYNFLRAARNRKSSSSSESTYIWADAICINQQDNAEKNYQVPLMRNIYRRARQVLVWLGDAGRDSELALPILPLLANAAEKQGAKLVVLDTLYPYGEADGEHITESTPWAATSRKGKLRAELDQQYLEAHRSGAVSTVLGRSADFFGPRVLNSTLGAAFFPGALTGGPALALGDIALPHSYTYIRDVASGLATLGTTGHGDGRVWHLPTAPATTTATIHALVEELVGQPLTVHLLSDPKPYGPFDEQFMAEYAEMFYQHRIPQNMVSAAFEETFGVAPTPLRHALSATVDWYREFLSQR
jgi:nucleoside-diphosphate-sugar epimerase